jgi:hypothetical protein
MPRRATKPGEVINLALPAALSCHYVRARSELHEAHKLIFAQEISQEQRRRMWKDFLAEVVRH